MRDLAPDITRQRLLVEGFFTIDPDADDVRAFLLDLAATLELRTYGEVTVHAPGGAGKDDNEGFDAFVPLIDSGISLYVWTARRFLALVVFTCKEFDVERAVTFTRERWGMTEIEHSAF